MSEKVLGFNEKDVEAIIQTMADKPEVWKRKIVPVNLKSESVTIEWLEKEFAKHDGFIVNTFKKEIMKKAKKQAGEGK